MNVKRYTTHNVEHCEFLPPDGFVMIHEHHPDINSDYSEGKHCRELAAVLQAAGIESAICPINRTNLAPWGSGPGGRIRAGDSMMPSVHRVFVPANKEAEARAAIEIHKQAVKAWIHHGAPMPEACRQ